MLESSDRIGGRVLTHYGEGWYVDLGAMRFPPSHHIFHGVASHLGIPLAPFAHLHKQPGSYFIVNRKYYSAASLGAAPGSVPDEASLLEVYRLFDIKDTADLRNASTGALLSPFTLVWDLLEQELSLTDYCKSDVSTLEFLRTEVRKRNLPEGFIRLWGSLDILRPFYDLSLLEFITDSNTMEVEAAEHEHKKYMEIVNGTDVLPRTMFERIVKFGERFTLMLEAQVHRVFQSSTGDVMVSFRGPRLEERVVGDRVIMTPPTPAQRSITWNPPLPYAKQLAMENLNYMGSVKIALVFTRAFWAEDNKAPPIKCVEFFKAAFSQVSVSGLPLQRRVWAAPPESRTTSCARCTPVSIYDYFDFCGGKN